MTGPGHTPTARGAPCAVQVADRFHLLQNISEVLEKLLHRNYKAVKAALRQSSPQVEELSAVTPAPPDEDTAAEAKSSAADGVPPRSQQYHAERKAVYELVQEMKRQGLNINQIRLQIKRHHSTVTRFFHAESYPVTTRRRGSRLAARFMDYLQKRWAEGCHNAKRLFSEIREQGYRGSDVTIRRMRKALPRGERGCTSGNVPPKRGWVGSVIVT